MKTLYVSQPDCYLALQQENIIVKKGDTILAKIQIPLLEQILVFGKSQISTQAIRTCLWRNIPIAYLSRMGYCYGRILPIERGYRQLTRYQQQLEAHHRLLTARQIVVAKLKNSRTILQRIQRKRLDSETVAFAIKSLECLSEKASRSETIERLMGLEGAGAATYFSAFGECLSVPEFVFVFRSRRPPGNPVNAMLSFGYQILWNHLSRWVQINIRWERRVLPSQTGLYHRLLAKPAPTRYYCFFAMTYLLCLIELQGLDPYQACLHQTSERHAALASDLIEEFRAPIIDSLVLWLINSKVMDASRDFVYRNSGCFLNDSGRAKFLHAFLQRMEEEIQTDSGEKQPRWDLFVQQVKAYKQFVYHPQMLYKPYRIH